jgi:hypothetical protein
VGKEAVRISVAAALVLRETKNPAVMWGDDGLLHQIAVRANARCLKTLKPAGTFYETSGRALNAILNALSRSPGELVPGYTYYGAWKRPVRIFYLPEHAPERLRKKRSAR